MENQIKKLQELGFQVEQLEDVIVVRKNDWHITFLIHTDKLVTFSGKIRKNRLYERTLYEYKKYYKEELERFFRNLFGNVKFRLSENMKTRIVTNFAEFIFKGKKLLEIKNIRDYNKVNQIINEYQMLIKGM